MEFKTGDPGVIFLAQASGETVPHKKTKKTAADTHASQASTVQASGDAASSPAAAESFHLTPMMLIGLCIVGAVVFIWLMTKLSNKRNDAITAQEEKEAAAEAKLRAAAPIRANYSIPHCDYTKTEEGFIVRFSKPGAGSMNLIHHNTNLRNKKASFTGLAVGLAGAAISTSTTIIEVTRQAVIIDGVPLSREDFGGFNYSEIQGSAKSYVRLMYQFGFQSQAIGGVWNPKEGIEFITALNQHLATIPMGSDTTVLAPEQLRDAARPTDF